MSMTTTSTASALSETSSCHQKLHDIPTHDAACAMPMKGNYSSIMSSCCSSAAVVEYGHCDHYCLAQGQTVRDLAECPIKGFKAGEVWCNTNANASATATHGHRASTTDAASTVTGTSSGASATSSSNAAANVVSHHLLSKSAIGMAGLLFVKYIAEFLI
ncbi:hypothetical protein N7492_003138 [Penicillium capsulatum]|uniref:Uncharacterized protein n=1 Tax=Penicillium capsulatum TaxID=69766 RepID=A0A9W9IKQ9_9EURO|nr:hypothetical protein N7492_003138 [Penicillium capsulatum]KAJ6122272.1 hypothetical protein N7512_004737 [Penicillium capsulatum]